ncbi:DNA topoisomerase 6 subunit A3 [Tanacetum coccineum]|uniref:DNA topoisomerase 6 subunit A3 n=1 Tax=Tanacetum coccineum TaxID=301880 RepID=A0ABQ5HB69_9ASTR
MGLALCSWSIISSSTSQIRSPITPPCFEIVKGEWDEDDFEEEDDGGDEGWGMGQRDVATQGFLKKLKKKLDIPMLALVDCDRACVTIMRTYTYGSRRISYDAKSLVTLGIEWLGLRPSDLRKFKIPGRFRLSMTPNDVTITKNLLNEGYVKTNKDLTKEELQWMLKLNKKAEIECLYAHDAQYLTEKYLPNKLAKIGFYKCKSSNFM